MKILFYYIKNINPKIIIYIFILFVFYIYIFLYFYTQSNNFFKFYDL